MDPEIFACHSNLSEVIVNAICKIVYFVEAGRYFALWHTGMTLNLDGYEE